MGRPGCCGGARERGFLPGGLAARHLERLFLSHGAPRVLRRDQGPEFESRVVQKRLRTGRIKDEPGPKGQPFDNGHMESFHGSLRDELLNAELFHSLGEAQTKVATWLNWYNSKRPPQMLGCCCPAGGSGLLWTSAPCGAAGDAKPWKLTSTLLLKESPYWGISQGYP